MCEWSNGGIPVPLPDDIYPEKELRYVCIDMCIIDQIKALWAVGCQTLGCCCGHGKTRPSVIVACSHTLEEIDRFADVLSNDSRSWDICQWQLVTERRTVGTCNST